MAFYRFSLPSRVLGFPVEMQALIPEEIQDIPTLWLLHGANSDCTEWFALPAGPGPCGRHGVSTPRLLCKHAARPRLCNLS